MTIGSVLRSRLDQRSDEALANRAAMEALWDEVAEQMTSVPTISGQRYVDRHRKRGKMLVRERIEALVDPTTPFLELSPLAGWGTDDAVGVGVAMGIGVVEGVQCAINGSDMTYKGGSVNPTTHAKLERLFEIVDEETLAGSTPRCTAAPATCPTWPSTNSMRCGSSGRSLPTSIGRRWSPAQPNPPTSRSTTQPMRAHPPGDRGGRLLPGHRGAPRWRHRPRSWAFRRSNTDHPAPFVDLGAEAVGVGPVSPLPSTVLEVQIEAGQQVSDGDLLVTLDAGD